MSLEEIELDLSDGSSVKFINYPLNKPFNCLSKHIKDINPNLENILLDPQEYTKFHSKLGKIFLGFGSDQPSDTYRFPVWFPVEDLTTHIFIGGPIKSGKTSLINRLVAGSLQSFGTVIVGEVKSGTKGFEQGAAFTELSKYLGQRLQIPTYRWPRGNCWFNPLKYLTKKDERLAFLKSISQQLNVSSDLLAFSDKASEIANCLLEYIKIFVVQERETLRTLVSLLGSWTKFEEDLSKFVEDIKQNQPKNTQSIFAIDKLTEIKQELTKRDFFRLDKCDFIATRAAVMALVSALSDDDLLFYSEPHTERSDGLVLQELEIDSILYNRSLVIISQPLEKEQSSKIIGSLFWDTLCRRTLELGRQPPLKNGKKRENILAVFDETNKLPVGELGNARQFSREYNIAVIEITPYIEKTTKVGQTNQWEFSQQVNLSFLSLYPHLEELIQFIYKNLPNQPDFPFIPNIGFDINGKVKPGFEVNRSAFQSGNDNPGISTRDLSDTGERTALLYLHGIRGIFWLDLESSLLGKLDELLKDANSPNATVYVKKAVDYALGLVMEFKP